MKTFYDAIDDGPYWQEFVKEAATIGELVGRATNGGIGRVARLPREAGVLAPRFRKAQAFAKGAGITRGIGKAMERAGHAVEKAAPGVASKMKTQGSKLVSRAEEAEAVPRIHGSGETERTMKIDMSTVPSNFGEARQRKSRHNVGGLAVAGITGATAAALARRSNQKGT